MKEKYRIVEIPKSVPPMWKLEEQYLANHPGKRYDWKIVCLGLDEKTLEKVRDDIIGQTIEKYNGLRE